MSRLARIAAIAIFGFGGWTAAAAAVAAPASACNISPGTPTCAPDALAINTSATLVQEASGSTPSPTDCDGNPAPPAAPCITVNWVEDVFSDPTNVYCANCLDWIVQATNSTNSQDIVARVTVSNFANFKTDLGIDTNPAPASEMGLSNSGTKSPNNVERNASGSVLSWDFNETSPTNNEINPGQTTVLLAVETNATRVVPGTVSFQDGVTAGAVALGPAIPDTLWVPALGLVGGAALGGAAIRRRRSPNHK